MAKVKHKVESDKYILTMNKNEFDLVAGIINDLHGEHDFGIARKVGMYYEEPPFDPATVNFPTKRGAKVIRKLANAVRGVRKFDPDYDYYEWWEVERPVAPVE